MENNSVISIKKSSHEHRELLFKWRNTDYLINLGSSGKTVEWEEHCRWHQDILKNKESIIFIIYYGKTPIGQIRYDCKQKDVCIISIYVLKEYAGRGIGTEAMRQSLEIMLGENRDRRFIAVIKSDNEASICFFKKNGFTDYKDYSNLPSGHVAMAYVRAVP